VNLNYFGANCGTHKDCGGIIREHLNHSYPYTFDDGYKCYIPALYCERCEVEVTGDTLIEEIE